MLTVDPNQRPEVEEILRHAWFGRPPTPVPLPLSPTSHGGGPLTGVAPQLQAPVGLKNPTCWRR